MPSGIYLHKSGGGDVFKIPFWEYWVAGFSGNMDAANRTDATPGNLGRGWFRGWLGRIDFRIKPNKQKRQNNQNQEFFHKIIINIIKL